MQCDLCKQSASVFLSEIINGHEKKLNLCETCAKERDIEHSTGFSILESLHAHEAAKESSPEPLLRCPQCGFTQENFKKTGRLGCSKCYEVFSESLDKILKSMHKGAFHIGKTAPILENQKKLLTQQIIDLKNHLNQAIQNEEYETAAHIRDKIKNLEVQAESH